MACVLGGLRLFAPDTFVGTASKAHFSEYDGSERRRPGRPRTRPELEALVVRIAEENRGWGYRRIQGGLSNMKGKLGRSTIAAILERHGIEPAPERNRRTTWKEFLTQHWELIVAADFFTVLADVGVQSVKLPLTLSATFPPGGRGLLARAYWPSRKRRV